MPEPAPLSLSVGANPRRQAPDPIGFSRVRRQSRRFGAARRTDPDRDRSARGGRHVRAGGQSTESRGPGADVAAAARAAEIRDRLAGRGRPGGRDRNPGRRGTAPRKRRTVEPRRQTAEEIAHAALAQLLAENLTGRGLVKEFYLRLTGIVRQYVEDTTGIRAPEQTTEEFLRDMRSRAVFPPERSVRLAEFLEAADLVKYAGQRPEQGQLEQAITRAHEFVNLKPVAGCRDGRRRRSVSFGSMVARLLQ